MSFRKSNVLPMKAQCLAAIMPIQRTVSTTPIQGIGEPLTGAERDARDGQLIDEFRGGDATALERLFRQLHPIALHYAARYASARLSAEDIVAEAFIRMIQAITNGKGPTVSVWWYLVSAMKTVAIRHGMSLRHTVNVEADTLEFCAELASEQRSEGVAEAWVVEAFHRLPARWQTVVWLRDVQALSLAEAAESLGISPNAVGTLHSRARKAFRLHYLAVIAGDETARSCAAYVSDLAGETDPSPETTRHLDDCPPCLTTAAELASVKHRFLGLPAMGHSEVAFIDS
ncbi:RNA polymerase sigma factor [Lysinibacter cavernae]|uniref:RNA polymerase sigma factor (Sigma-70 family) n=1 Tax=Lysinibacter cavernae TaxID=1640652 RepID=A0A7X5QZS5_9MICO|nr:sigma-70 family RNA polymerase sigma factor [Lysinibacter cavernae]NIH52948.1 RNA polymerase sigma factor (sigma-70 family) [Lysinibacter cavernae]